MKYRDLSFGQAEDAIDKLGGMDGLGKLLSGEWIVGEPGQVRPGTANARGKVIDDLLEIVSARVESPAIERFVARDRFMINRGGELPVSYIGEDFTGNFLGLIEDDVKAAKLSQYKLLKSTIDAPIFVALGGQDKARIPLAHVFNFLKTADRSLWFFFYVADIHGELWAVDTYWRDHGWDIEAYSVTYPRGWRGGGRVVST